MAKLHFSNMAPSSKKATLLSVLDDSHVFTRNETMQASFEFHGNSSYWKYYFSLVMITNKTKEELEYLLDEIFLEPMNDYIKKYKFIEPPVGSEFYNLLRNTGQLSVTFTEFEQYIELV
jgi:hypothetical protein